MIGNSSATPMAAEWQDLYRVGPGTLAGRYLRRWWHPVARAQDLHAGRALPIRSFGEDFTLYRGEAGRAHALAFRCAHRGTQLSTGWVEGDNLRCFYHGWAYGPDGQCVEQPAEPEPFCGRIKIKSYPTEEYLGLIFVYLGEGSPPELPRYPALEGEGLLQVTQYTWPCSYMNSLENGVDLAHLAFVHRDLRAELGLIGVPRVAAEETEFGIDHVGTRPDGGQQHVLHIWPNVLQRRSGPPRRDMPWNEALAWRVPIDDESFTSFGLVLIHFTGAEAEAYSAQQRARLAQQPFTPATEVGASVLRGELQVWDVEDRRVLNAVQDYVAQVGQAAIPARTAWHLGRSDVAVTLLRSIFVRELRALADGRDLKAWRLPVQAVPTSGLAASAVPG